MLTEEITTNALRLSAVDRIYLAEALLESLDITDSQVEKKWIDESEKRYHAYKEGQIKGMPLEQVCSKIQK